jgi:hypothetical protein
LSASWNVSGYSEIGFAVGISYLDWDQNRGAYGLSGIGVLPTKEELVVQLPAVVEEHARAFLLLPPQPAITKDNMNINANRPIFSMKSPFAGTVVETDCPCPQLGNWPCLAEASAGRLTSASCYHVEENNNRNERETFTAPSRHSYHCRLWNGDGTGNETE